jgi:hypothetical protein
MKHALPGLLALAALCNAKLTIYGPEALKKTFAKTDGVIEASYSNFGHIPYG